MTTPGVPRRILFVAHPAVAHVNPLASVANELAERGHHIEFICYPEFKAPLDDRVRFHGIKPDASYAEFLESEFSDSVRSTGGALMSAWGRLIPLCRAMLDDVQSVANTFRPEVMVVDQHALAGSLVARRLDIPWVTSAPSAALIADPLPEEASQGPKWVKSVLDELQVSLGMEPIEEMDQSPLLVLLYTTSAFAGRSRTFPSHYRFVGANIDRRLDGTSFPWELLDPACKRVYVSFGSIIGARAGRLLQVCVDAFRDQPMQVIVSDPATVLQDVPANFIVRRWLPQIELLPKVDAVLTHGGSSVNEALAFGVPLVVAPYHLDNYIYATKLVEAGAGLRVRFARVGPLELRHTVVEVLDNPSYRQAAKLISDSYVAAGGTSAAADEIEALLARMDEAQP